MCNCNSCEICKGTRISEGSVGATGSQGIPGPQGPPGATGPQGVAGATGADGSDGADGATGPTGPQGPAGADGVAGDRFSTTSTTSLLISIASKSFTVGTGLAYVPAQPVIISNSGTDYMTGTITSYNSGTGAVVVNVTSITGAGTFASWSMSLSGVQGPPGATGATGPTGATGSTGATGATGPAGPTGPQGIQGIQGAIGPQGPQGPAGTGGTVIQNGAGIPTASAATGTYYVDSTNNSIYVNTGGTNWTLVLQASGPSTPGVFTSGVGVPSGTAAINTVYLDLNTALLYYYNGSAWIPLPTGYAVTAYQVPTLVNSFVTGSPDPFLYRQQGGCIKFKGRITNSSPTFDTTDIIITTLAAGYRPATAKYQQVIDIFGGIIAIIQIATTGIVTLKRTIIGCNTNNINLDTVFFDLT
jgi:hypothetical protein